MNKDISPDLWSDWFLKKLKDYLKDKIQIQQKIANSMARDIITKKDNQ